jgi:ADP-ribose pyrophosphatase YjhB (NUDIX family)
VERGESLEQAVKREIQEEVGLHFEPRKLIWECSLEGLDFYLYWFNGQAKMGSITLSPKEAEAFEWMSKQAILEHAKVLPRTKEFFEKIIK